MTRQEIADTSLQIDRRKLGRASDLTEKERVAISEAARSDDQELASMASGIAFDVLENYTKGRINALGKGQNMEDELQKAFAALHTRLPLYNPKYSLITFFTPILVDILLVTKHKPNNHKPLPHMTLYEQMLKTDVRRAIINLRRKGKLSPSVRQIKKYIQLHYHKTYSEFAIKQYNRKWWM